MSKILTIAFKDLLRSFRSLFAVGMMFIAPLLITGLIYFAFGSMAQGEPQSAEMQALKVGIINLDQPSAEIPDMGQLVVDFLQNPSLPEWLEAVEIAIPSGGEPSIDLETYGVVVVIPANFSSVMLQSGSKAALDIYYDPALSIQPQVIKALLTNFTDGLSSTSIAMDVITRHYGERQLTLDASSRQRIINDLVGWSTDLQMNMQSLDPATSHIRATRPAAASQETSPSNGANILALVMAGQVIFFAFYTGAYTCTSILREQEEGTLARLFTTPTPRTSILAGKFVAVFLTVIVQALVLLLLSALIFQISWGAALGLALVVFGLVVSAAGLGVFLISLVKNERQSGAVLGGVLTFAGMAGGLFTVAVPNMPAAFQTINLLLPQGWALGAFRILLQGGAPLDLLQPVGVLLTFGLVLFALGAALFNKRFA